MGDQDASASSTSTPFAATPVTATEAALTASTGHRRQTTGYIDLRPTLGGLLNEAVRVSDAFLDRGEIVSSAAAKRATSML